MSVKFEVLIPGVGENKSVIMPVNCLRGQFLVQNGMDAQDQITAKLAVATDDTLLGFSARDVDATGQPSVTDLLFGGRLETAAKAGLMVSVEPPPELFAVEDGTTWIDATYLAAVPAVGDLINFAAGKARKPAGASGQYAFYKLVGIAADADGTATNRFTFQRLQGNIKV